MSKVSTVRPESSASSRFEASVKLSVIVCTYNRCENLPACFAALEAQRGTHGVPWEVVVVDNNSTDETRESVERAAQASTLDIRYVFEPEQGLSAARNAGIGHARGDYLTFIDDDIRVERDWLAAIADTFRRYHCDVVGGRIHVEAAQPLPVWITPEMYGFLGHRDFGEEPDTMDGVSRFPFGGNMAIRREIFEQVGLFDTELGRKGEGRVRAELLKGEETEFFRRVAGHGGTFRYEPAALVKHHILPHQLRKRFFRTLQFNAGVQKAGSDPSTYRRCVFGIPLFLFRQASVAAGRYVGQVLTAGTNKAFRQQSILAYFLGLVVGYWNRSRSG